MFGRARVLAFAFAAALALPAAPAGAANWLEMDFYMSGPEYEGKLPPCDYRDALVRIASRLYGILAHCPYGFDGSVPHGWQCRSRGARRGRGVAHSRNGCRCCAGSAPERIRSVRLLRALALLVPDVLRSLGRTRHTTPAAMRRATLLLRGARALAAIREGIPGILPAAGAAARPQYHLLDARSDAGTTPDLQRMGPAWHLLGAFRKRLLRNGAQGARAGEDSGPLYRAEHDSHRDAGRGRGGLRQSQSRAYPRCDRGDLRQPALGRGSDLPRQRSALPRLPRDRCARLPSRAGRDAPGARWKRRGGALACLARRETIARVAGEAVRDPRRSARSWIRVHRDVLHARCAALPTDI